MAFCGVSVLHAATASFTNNTPTLGPNDISNLIGSPDGPNNVDGGDQYIAGNQRVLGQTFTTGSNPLGYKLTAVTLRHVTYNTYASLDDLTYTIRVTSPSGGTLSVLASETAFVPLSTPGNIPDTSGTAGSGIYITFTFACPPVLSPNTTYGFDVGNGGAFWYWETDGTISNAYAGGVGYRSGSDGVGDTTFTTETGDRVFVAALTAVGTLVSPCFSEVPKSLTLYAGRTAQFTAKASGSPTLVYQWQKNGTNVPNSGNVSGAMTDTLTIANIATGNAGNYTLVVTNSAGSANSITSAPVSLTVVAAPSTGTYAYAVMTNDPVAYWRLDDTGNPATNSPAYDFAGGFTGNYEVSCSNGFNGIVGPRPSAFPGFESSNNAAYIDANNTPTWVTLPPLFLATNRVTMTAWIHPNGAQADYCGLFESGGGNAGLAYGGDFSSNAGQLIYWWSGSTYTFVSGLTIPSDQWSFVAVVVEPTQATLYLGTNGALNAAVDFTIHQNETFGSAGEIGRQPGNNGRIFNGSIDEVAVFKRALTFDQINALYDAGLGSTHVRPPVITKQPLSSGLYAGQTAHFAASALGSSPLNYQWRKGSASLSNGGNVSGALTDSLSLSSVAGGDVASYTLVVTNSATSGNSVTSAPASLTVVAAPSPGSYAFNVFSHNPVAYWRLGEIANPATNPPAYDYVGGLLGRYEVGASNGFNGIVGPRPTAFPGFESTNTAVRTTGTGDGLTPTWVTIPALNLNTNTVTMTAWIYPSGPQVDYAGLLISSEIAGFAYGGAGSANAGQLMYWWNGSSTYTYVSGLVIPSNQWSFVAVVIEPTKASLYLGTNGILNTAVDSGPHTSEAWAANGQIGSQGVTPDDRVFAGSIDEVAVFNYSFTPAQVLNLYQNGFAPPLTIQKVGASLQLTWPQGTLLEATNVNGPYTTNNAASPYTFGPTGAMKFFRVKVQ